jgi:ABC-type bacteriocin/lantibiotic exporter with double-glycine peptidase domain
LCLACISDDWHPPVRDDYVVLQRRDDDCGLAAITTLLRLAGTRIGYDEVARGIAIGELGLTLREMSRITARWGVATEAYHVNRQSGWINTRTPGWIALLGMARLGHYVVVRNVVADTVFVYDPKEGRRAMKRDRFEAEWTGYALLPVNETPNLTRRAGPPPENSVFRRPGSAR